MQCCFNDPLSMMIKLHVLCYSRFTFDFFLKAGLQVRARSLFNNTRSHAQTHRSSSFHNFHGIRFIYKSFALDSKLFHTLKKRAFVDEVEASIGGVAITILIKISIKSITEREGGIWNKLRETSPYDSHIKLQNDCRSALHN